MIGAIFCILALTITYLLARRSFVNGILSVITVGYFYGIVRANFFEMPSHFIFDTAVIGLYAARFRDINRNFATIDGQRLKHWVTLLLLIPLIMFCVPLQDYLIQVVGLRGNAFLIPFVLIGTAMSREDWDRIGLWLAVLNLVALAFGAAEYALGVERFFPYNAVTDIIYRSNDVGANNALRIPALFASAHAYGGTMVVTLPIIANAWIQKYRHGWRKHLLVAGLLACILSVFLSATRVHFIMLVVLLIVATFSIRARALDRVGWIAVLLLVGTVVSTHDRLQRFTTLDDRETLEERLHVSVNTTLLNAMIDYPFGIGLGAGGTSVPFFLMDRVNAPVAIESEWGRIELETGLIGLAVWPFFLFWVFSRKQPRRDDPAFLGLRLAWVAALCFFATGFIGIGLFTSIPQSVLLLMLVGWIATHHTGEADRPVLAPAPYVMKPITLPVPQRELVQR